METILSILTLGAFLFVIFTLIMGATKLGGKKEGDREKSNIWMRRRVLGQAIAVGLLLALLWVKSRGA